MSDNFRVDYKRDFAAEFRAKADEIIENSTKSMQQKNNTVTIPIGQQTTSNGNQTGLVVERQKPEVEPLKVKEDNSAVLQEAKKLTTEKGVKNAEYEARKEYYQYGFDGENPYESAEKYAESKVKNEQYKEEFNSTQVFMDKDAYKKAEEQRKSARKDLIKQYREEGLTKKAAKEKADSQLVKNEYLSKWRNNNTRKYIESHKDEFYENGQFSSDKFKAKALEVANKGTSADEETNYYASLDEQRAAAAEEGTNRLVMKTITRKSGLGHQQNNTVRNKIAFIGGITAAGAAAGGLAASAVGASALSGSSAAAGATATGAAAGSSAAAGAGATVGLGWAPGAIAGGLAAGGAATGASPFLKFLNTKSKDIKVYNLNKPQPQVQQPQEQVQQQPQEQVQQPQEQVQQPQQQGQPQTCPVQEWASETCEHRVEVGQDWGKIAIGKVKINGKTPDGKFLKAYNHAEKLKHGITNFKLNTMPAVFNQKKYDSLKTEEEKQEYIKKHTVTLYSDFSDLLADEATVKAHPELKLLKDAQITFDCDGKVKHGNSTVKPRVKYTQFTGSPSAPVCYKQDCNDQVPVMVIKK